MDVLVWGREQMQDSGAGVRLVCLSDFRQQKRGKIWGK